MARKQKKAGGGGGGASWMVTFSDLMTLLLTFFVLLLTMSSMDRSILTKLTLFTQDLGYMTYKGSGRIPTRIRLVNELLERPWELLDKQERIKDLLFPDDVIPPDINRSTLLENVQVLARPEGAALVLSDQVLFERGGWELSDRARVLLGQVVQVLSYTNAPVNVSGFTDEDPVGAVDEYELSARRAMSVLEYFLVGGQSADRFTVSGYGPNWPLEAEWQETNPAKNRRVEVLLKTTPWLGAYSQ